MKMLITGAAHLDKSELVHIKNMGCDISFVQFENDEISNTADFEYIICNRLFDFVSVERFEKLKCVQFVSAGVSEKTQDLLKNRNIKYFTAGNTYAIPMAESVIMQILNIYRYTEKLMQQQKEHVWNKQRDCIELYGKKALIIGYGNVGKEVYKRLSVFGVKVSVANRTCIEDADIEKCYELFELNDIIDAFDIIIVSIAETRETVGLINLELLKKIRKPVIIVNVSRGSIIVQEALVQILKENKDIKVALDVFDNEPLPENNPLWDMENVIITPHNSFVGDNVHTRLFQILSDNIEKYLKIR